MQVYLKIPGISLIPLNFTLLDENGNYIVFSV